MSKPHEDSLSLEDYSWAELKDIADEIASANSDFKGLEIAGEYGLIDADGLLKGDTKSVSLADGTKAHVRIVGFRHDVRADTGGKAGITFEFADAPATYWMNSAADNSGGWEKSEMRIWLNDEFATRLPEDLRLQIVKVKKLTNNQGRVGEEGDDVSMVTTTTDSIWLLSSTEVFGDFPSEYYNECVYNAEGDQYQLYSDQHVFKGYEPGNGSFSFCAKDGAYSWWWLRSPVVRQQEYFDTVAADGDWDNRAEVIPVASRRGSACR